jgi:hypothetical protein
VSGRRRGRDYTKTERKHETLQYSHRMLRCRLVRRSAVSRPADLSGPKLRVDVLEHFRQR